MYKKTSNYIPLDASESAVFQDNNSLLPLSIYSKLAEFISLALNKISTWQENNDLNSARSHHAVSIDGSRGTGKTSVLVNLRLYLKNDEQYPEILKRVHILDPIDPTLLEESESLFLHIIVAALLADKDVKLVQNQNPEKSLKLNKSLEKLAHALSSIENQKIEYGMDKLRALFGNRHLADCVQDFFKATLDILDKKLLVLPIDDVDTSLNRAFENLEIIRRYLTTPYVLPIVSGDRRLYDEVTWRDFHSRLIKDSAYKIDKAFLMAKDLSTEYQRKLLPLPRRLTMPDVKEYLNDKSIELRIGNEKCTTLNNFHAWLKIFINGPVNGLEGSDLPLPIPSIRALTQLINQCSQLIPNLPDKIRSATNELEVQRLWQMPYVSPSAIENFHIEYNRQSNRAGERDYASAYQKFATEFNQQDVLDFKKINESEISNWEQTLLDYFQFESKAGVTYLVLMAYNDWRIRSESNGERLKGVFDTPLFQPFTHSHKTFDNFEKNNDFSEWIDRLKDSLPESWFNSLKSRKTILPYPIAEVGILSGTKWKYWESLPDTVTNDNTKRKIIFLASLSMQYNFYNSAKQSFMLNVGRIFELIISSLVGDVSITDLQRILQNSSFFSASALAPTKTVKAVNENITNSEDDEDNTVENRPSIVSDLQNEEIINLYNEIIEWRKVHKLEEQRFSPWLIYKVFNKVYSQFANTKQIEHGFRDLTSVMETIGKVFYSTWSAFGSFEKGILFGLPEIIATVNLNTPRNFDNSNDHFNVNLAPFVSRSGGQRASDKNIYGMCTRTASFYLYNHPMRLWIEAALEALPKKNKINQSKSKDVIYGEEVINARSWVIKELGFENDARLTDKRLSSALAELSFRERKSLIKKMHAIYPEHNLTIRLQNIIDLIEAEE